MTAIAVINIVFGAIGILNGLYLVIGYAVLIYQLTRLGVFELPMARAVFADLVLSTGIVGLAAGIGILRLRPWARMLSLAYGGLLLLSCVCSFVAVPIISTIGTYDIGSISGFGLVRLIIFSAIYIVIPVPYSIILWALFYRPAWRTTFAKV